MVESKDEVRAKTSLRMTYEAKSQIIKKQLGGLEGVQETLGLSQRKMAQLLMVDPSTWNRWSKNEDFIPPHIWRSLEWYLALQNKIPGLSAHHFIGRKQDEIEKHLSLFETKLDKEQSIKFESLKENVFKENTEIINQLKKQILSLKVYLCLGVLVIGSLILMIALTKS